jgi:DNA mismatch endonuclease, patch repair protein
MMPYIRDARSPVPSSAAASRIMSANRPANTSPELALRRALSAADIRGYRLHRRVGTVRPDIVFGPAKLAVFVHGCFWHHCPKCDLPTPRSNSAFWREKFARNAARDAQKLADLRALGWRAIVVWEHEVRDSLDAAVAKIAAAHRSRR